MRLVYVDEAGISDPKQEPWLVVAGVIVYADRKLEAIERHLDDLVDRYIPEHQRSNFVFHAKELFNGGGKVFDRDSWPLEKRLRIAGELADIPKKFNLPVVCGYVERAKFPETFPADEMTKKDLAIGAHTTAYMRCAIHIDLWMRANAKEEVCAMVVEDNDLSRAFIREAHIHHQSADRLGPLTQEERRYLPLRKIKEEPFFQRKRKSSPLQVADFCAYVLKRFLMNKDDERYRPFFEPIRKQFANYR